MFFSLIFGAPHETGCQARRIVAVGHDPSASNDRFASVRRHHEIDCVPSAKHVNTFDGVAVSRGVEQSSTEDGSISRCQSERSGENSRLVPAARATVVATRMADAI
jgi:hypothetical protein